MPRPYEGERALVRSFARSLDPQVHLAVHGVRYRHRSFLRLSLCRSKLVSLLCPVCLLRSELEMRLKVFSSGILPCALPSSKRTFNNININKTLDLVTIEAEPFKEQCSGILSAEPRKTASPPWALHFFGQFSLPFKLARLGTCQNRPPAKMPVFPWISL